jgi:hypothetical protein
MVTNSNKWSQTVTLGHKWSQTVTNGHKWSQTVTRHSNLRVLKTGTLPNQFPILLKRLPRINASLE